MRNENTDSKSLFSHELLWETMFHVADIGIFWKDKERRFLGANQFFLDYYGFDSVDEILGKTDEDMNWHPSPDSFREDELRVLLLGEKTHQVQGECLVKGEERILAASKFPIYRDGEIVGLMGYFTDITEEIRNREKLLHIANTDGLTGIRNRRSFEQDLERWCEEAGSGRCLLSCIMLDIDFFKEYNDFYGHPTGDRCLRHVARILEETAKRCGGIAARYGGEEFILLLFADGQRAEQAALEVKRSLEKERIPHGGSTISPYVTVSMGIFTADTRDVPQCWTYIAGADKALYNAKSLGRNRIRHLDEIG